MVTPALFPFEAILEDIQKARRRIRDSILPTPCPRAAQLEALTGCQLFLKLENLQMTGSFKVRGALSRMLLLTEAERARGVLAASAGNHAQGVAYAARLLGMNALIVMPETAPLAKVRGTQVQGAEIVLAGGGYDAAYARALDIQAQRGSTFIHAFDDPAVIAGQGTIGLEILEQLGDFDAAVVPVGGGGLIAGIGAAIKENRPSIRVIGVQAERICAMKASMAAGEITPLPAASTLADGISVARVGSHTFPLVRRYVDGIVTVGEEEIARAIMILLEREKLLAEGAGVVGLAALLAAQIPDLAGKRVVVIISGGNIDTIDLTKILDRGLEQDGRLARLRVVVPDKPGSIAELAGIIAAQRANILQIAQNRNADEVGLREAEVELTLETRGQAHVQEIEAAFRGRGYSVK
ncbi:MAG: threonine ammonia-lyase [Candidatus Competibacteraceae bacterium]|nr:threonine ammonia-lyase [Candidatus Competibacteraceae bacterium]